MPDKVLPAPLPNLLREHHQKLAAQLRASDIAPASRAEWERRRVTLRQRLLEAIGPMPNQDVELAPRILGEIRRPGFRVEKLVFQSRPDVWVTANAFVPDGERRFPAVLCVHGHWAGARRDPVVQARCLGLVRLGYFVLLIDAFGSGERYSVPAKGTYHGANYGTPLWPTGQTLLGAQVYDNRRAVDYLLTRREVDGSRIGITGASGGGNQSMYAGALDERITAIVPVCSVGTYPSFLRTVCCVCEVVPSGIRFTDVGEVLGLIAPRATLVITASQDSVQFGPEAAAPSVRRARTIFDFFGASERFKHLIVDAKHDYNQAMREAMYGWMGKWLGTAATDAPIPEPKEAVFDPAELACYPNPEERPKTWLFPPSLAGREAKPLLAKLDALKPNHPEDWQATVVYQAKLLNELLGTVPALPRPVGKPGTVETDEFFATRPIIVDGEIGPLPILERSRVKAAGPKSICILLHADGKSAALKHPMADGFLTAGWTVAAVDLRGWGETKPANDGTRDAPDHTSTQHAIWVGRPMLGQWVHDALTVVNYLAMLPNRDARLAIAGVGPAGLVGLVAALYDTRITEIFLDSPPATLSTSAPYSKEMRLGVVVPGLFRAGDVPHLAAYVAPRRVVIGSPVLPSGPHLPDPAPAFAFTTAVYRTLRAEKRFQVLNDPRWDEVAKRM